MTVEFDDLLRQLEENLQKARDFREHASVEFDAAIRIALAPDRADRLTAASKTYSDALEAVNKALKEYNDLLVFKKRPVPATPIEPETQPGEKTG